MLDPKLIDDLVDLIQTSIWIILAIAFMIVMKECY